MVVTIASPTLPGMRVGLVGTGKMGGAIWLESQPAQGSTVHFTAQFRLPTPDASVLELAADERG